MGENRPAYREFEKQLKEKYNLFETFGVKATKISDANPNVIKTVKQLLAFKNQLDPDIKKNYDAAGGEI